MSATFLRKIRHKFHINTHTHALSRRANPEATEVKKDEKLSKCRWYLMTRAACVCVCVLSWMNICTVCVCVCVTVCIVCVTVCIVCVCVCVCVCVHCAKDVCVRAFMCVGSRYKFLTHLPVWVWNYWIDASIPSKRHLQTCSFYFIPLFILCPVYWPVFPACNHRLLEALPFSNSANVSSLLSHSEHYRLQMFPHEKRWYILFLPGALHVCTLARP